MCFIYSFICANRQQSKVQQVTKAEKYLSGNTKVNKQ